MQSLGLFRRISRTTQNDQNSPCKSVSYLHLQPWCLSSFIFTIVVRIPTCLKLMDHNVNIIFSMYFLQWPKVSIQRRHDGTGRGKSYIQSLINAYCLFYFLLFYSFKFCLSQLCLFSILLLCCSLAVDHMRICIKSGFCSYQKMLLSR